MDVRPYPRAGLGTGAIPVLLHDVRHRCRTDQHVGGLPAHPVGRNRNDTGNDRRRLPGRNQDMASEHELHRPGHGKPERTDQRTDRRSLRKRVRHPVRIWNAVPQPAAVHLPAAVPDQGEVLRDRLCAD